MTRVRVESFTISLDGYGADPHQDLENPLGVGGTDWHQWLFRTRTDVRIGGGASTIRQYLRAGSIDEMHFAISPIMLGLGERLFEDIDLRALGYECTRFVGTEKATQVVLRRS